MDAEFWSDKRAPGVLNQVDVDSYQSIVEVFETAVSKHAARPAFTGINHTLTFADIDKFSRDFAAYLQNNTTLQPGDRIAIQMPNLLQFPIAVFGALRAGLVVVNTNPLYTAREMHHQFNDSGAKALIFLDVFGERVEKIINDTPIEYLIVTSLADMLPAPKRILINGAAKYIKKMVPPFNLPQTIPFRTALTEGSQASFDPPPASEPNDVAMLQYTGGTTGVAKGAMLTHRNIISNMMQVRAVLSQLDEQGNPIHIPGQEVLIAPLPLYHIYAFTCHLMCLMELGDHSILIANPRDTKMFIRLIKPWQFTGFVGLNTLFNSLLNHPDFTQCDFSKLKLTLSGGTALAEDISKRWKEVTGCQISEAYGLTECSPAVCINPVGSLAQVGTAGLPLPNTILKTIDDNGNETPIEKPGELCVKGPQVMKGYWQRPEATSEILDKDGWLKTGDVAVIHEDGFVRIVDRLKDLILVSGFNVYPNEIEDVVAAHPDVDICAVIGIPDDKTGEAAKLFVVAKDESLTRDQIITWCRDHLTAYKVPKIVEFRDELPMTPVGKILRKDLRVEEEKKQVEKPEVKSADAATA